MVLKRLKGHYLRIYEQFLVKSDLSVYFLLKKIIWDIYGKTTQLG